MRLVRLLMLQSLALLKWLELTGSKLDNQNCSSAITSSLSDVTHFAFVIPTTMQLSEDERERMRVKRERNRVAAAKCRNRRRELLERLEKVFHILQWCELL